MAIRIYEEPSWIWDLRPTFNLRIDRSGTTVTEYLHDCGVVWQSAEGRGGDVILTKGTTDRISCLGIFHGLKTAFCSDLPRIVLLGEPRELAPLAYLLARHDQTLAVAPGSNLKRLYFASEWLDPRLDDWHKRSDRICWFARPTPERVGMARMMEEAGVQLDIYSREPWPSAAWLGYAEDEVATSGTYRYRLVAENSCRFGYHSEKLFNSIRSGCVTFYHGDPELELGHAAGAFLRYSLENVKDRHDLAPDVKAGINKFMFSDAWEIYSFRRFYDRIIELAEAVIAP